MASAKLNDKYYTGVFADISTAQTVLIPVVADGYLTEVRTVLGGAITGADAVVTVKVNTTTAGTITVAYTSSAAGDIDVLTDLRVAVKTGDYLSIATDGASSTAAAAGFVAVVKEIGG